MPHVVSEATWTGERLELSDPAGYKAQLKRMKLGAGERLIVRVERVEDAITEWQRRYYFGACIRPLSEYTGFTEPEMHLMVKTACMPPDKTSITELSKEEMRLFIDAVQRWAAEIVGFVIEDPGSYGVPA